MESEDRRNDVRGTLQKDDYGRNNADPRYFSRKEDVEEYVKRLAAGEGKKWWT